MTPQSCTKSDKLTLRLQPCDVVARVAPAARRCARFELDVAQRLADAGSPVAAPEAPEVFVRGDHVVTLWTYYEPMTMQAIPHSHPGNLLPTRTGPLFIDVETCCRGPVEFDLAHAPGEVAAHYPGIGHRLGIEWPAELSAGRNRPTEGQR
jgi:hypothetical protein